jgi:nucleoside phosphorylase
VNGAIDLEDITLHTKLKKIFLHYFDIHFLEEKGKISETAAFKMEVRRATRIAVASSFQVLIPAASYFESPLCREIISELDELVSLGIIELVGSSHNTEEFVRERLDTKFYANKSVQNNAYRTALNSTILLPYLKKESNTTTDIITEWSLRVSDGSLHKFLSSATDAPIRNLENLLEKTPEELGRSAFIPSHVYKVLNTKKMQHLPIQNRIRNFINGAYFDSYLHELNCGIVIDLSFLNSNYIPDAQNISFRMMVNHCRKNNLLEHLDKLPPSELIRLGDNIEWQAALHTFTTHVQPIKKSDHTTVREEKMTATTVTPAKSVLCIVASQSELQAVANYLTNSFGAHTTERKEDTFVLKFHDKELGINWFVGKLSFQGETDSAATVIRLDNLINPSIVFMLGMCMGMPNQKKPVGTVVIPNEVFAFDHKRITTAGIIERPHGQRVDNVLYKLVELVAALPPQSIKFKILTGKALASSSVKVEDGESEFMDTIIKSFPDVAAFDMEGAGFYMASSKKPCLLLKAIADHGEAQEVESDAQTIKAATQSSVTENAVAVAVALVSIGKDELF